MLIPTHRVIADCSAVQSLNMCVHVNVMQFNLHCREIKGNEKRQSDADGQSHDISTCGCKWVVMRFNQREDLNKRKCDKTFNLVKQLKVCRTKKREKSHLHLTRPARNIYHKRSLTTFKSNRLAFNSFNPRNKKQIKF